MSGDNKTTQTQTNQPYKAAKPLLDKGMGDALSLYKSGGLVKPNTMSTVVPYAQQTMQGMQGLQSLAGANSGGQGLSGHMQGIIDAGGYNPDQQAAVAGLRSTATTPFDINANPAYAGIRQRAIDAASQAVTSQASGLGRTGSGVHQGVLAREVGDVAGRMDYNEYNNHLARQNAAQQQLFNAGQTAQGNIGDAFQTAHAPMETQMGVGAQFEDLMGRQMNDQLRITNELQSLPLANIQALLAAAGGAGNYGTQTSTAQGPSNTFSNVLGAGLGGLSLLGML